MCWVKANFPMCWFAVMLDDDISKFSVYLAEARSHGITVLPPHVSFSKQNTVIEDKDKQTIRTGLTAIKGVGDAAVEEIIAHQPYTSINDFLERAGSKAINKRVVEALITADAFAGLPIIFDDQKEDSPLYGKQPIVLKRSQLLQWYTLVNEYKNKKPDKCYEIDKNILSRSLQEDPTLVFRKEGTIIVPYSFLSEFGFKDSDIPNLTVSRKKPEGRLVVTKSKLPPFYQPFIYDEQTIINNKKSNIEEYIYDIQAFGYSLRPHPLEKVKSHIAILKDMLTDERVCVAGLLLNVNKFKSKKGNDCYDLEIITPHETYNQVIFNSIYKRYGSLLKPGKFIRIDGYKDDRGTIKNIREIQDVTNDAIKFAN